MSEGEDKCTPEKKNDFLFHRLKEIAKEFMLDTSCHACKFVVDLKWSTAARCMWALTVLALIGGLLYVAASLGLKYQKHPFNTNIQVEPKTSLGFPAVTICNMNEFDISQPGVPNNTREFLHSVSTFKELFAARGAVNLSAEAYKSARTIPLNTLTNMTWNMKSFTKFCIWMKSNAICREMFTEVETYMGRCIQFNGNPSAQLYVNSTSYQHGLQLILDVRQEGYSQANQPAAGVGIFIHEPGEFADMLTNVLYVGPGSYTALSVRQKLYQFLPSPYRAFGDETCSGPEDPGFSAPLTPHGTYSRSVCLRDCVSSHVLPLCGCKSNIEADNADYPWCTLEQYIVCYKVNAANLYEQFRYDNTCNCPKPCAYVTYDITQTQAVFPSSLAAGIFELLGMISNSSTARLNVLYLSIFYDSFLVESMTSTPEYSLDDIASSLGGTMGFFLGVSCVTLMEVITLFVSMAAATVRWCWHKVKTRCFKKRIGPHEVHFKN